MPARAAQRRFWARCVRGNSCASSLTRPAAGCRWKRPLGPAGPIKPISRFRAARYPRRRTPSRGRSLLPSGLRRRSQVSRLWSDGVTYPGERAQSDWLVGRARPVGADLGDGLAERVGHHRADDRPADAALARPHAAAGRTPWPGSAPARRAARRGGFARPSPPRSGRRLCRPEAPSLRAPGGRARRETAGSPTHASARGAAAERGGRAPPDRSCRGTRQRRARPTGRSTPPPRPRRCRRHRRRSTRSAALSRPIHRPLAASTAAPHPSDGRAPRPTTSASWGSRLGAAAGDRPALRRQSRRRARHRAAADGAQAGDAADDRDAGRA